MYCSICKVHYKNRSEFGTREKRKSATVRKCKKCKEESKEEIKKESKKEIPLQIYRGGYYDEDDYYQRTMEYIEARWNREYDEEENNSYYRNDEYGYYGDSYEI